MHLSSNSGSSFKKSATKALAHTPAIPVTSVQLSGPSLPVGSQLSPESLAFESTGQRQTDICDCESEMAVVSPDPPVSQGEMRNRQISEGCLCVPSERQPSPSANYIRHPSPCSVPTNAWPFSPSLNDSTTDSTGASQSTVSPSTPVDLSVFDWKSIPNPLVETTIPMST